MRTIVRMGWRGPKPPPLTPETWAACPQCNGPSLPRHDWSSYPRTVDAACAACGFRWFAREGAGRAAIDALNWKTGADVQPDELDHPLIIQSRAERWADIVRIWRHRRLLERAAVRKLQEGRW